MHGARFLIRTGPDTLTCGYVAFKASKGGVLHPDARSEQVPTIRILASGHFDATVCKYWWSVDKLNSVLRLYT